MKVLSNKLQLISVRSDYFTVGFDHPCRLIPRLEVRWALISLSSTRRPFTFRLCLFTKSVQIEAEAYTFIVVLPLHV